MSTLLFKTYKALLTQVDTDEPVLRVLNQDAEDFTPITFSLDTNIVSTEDFDESLTILSLGVVIGGKIVIPTIEGGYTNAPLEITIRQRGEAPVPTYSKTNEDGSKVILFFNKEISDYTLSLLTAVTIDGNTGATAIDTVERGGVINSVEFSNSGDGLGIASGDVVLISFDGSVDIESNDYGLLAEFIDFEVEDYVYVEPANFDLVSAKTDFNGSQLILTFDKDLDPLVDIAAFTLTNATISGVLNVNKNVLTLQFATKVKMNQAAITISLADDLSALDGSLCNSFSSVVVKNNVD